MESVHVTVKHLSHHRYALRGRQILSYSSQNEVRKVVRKIFKLGADDRPLNVNRKLQFQQMVRLKVGKIKH